MLPSWLNRDLLLLYTSAFVRALATGMGAILLGLYLAALEISPTRVGLIIAAGLAGGMAATVLVTFFGERLGRRRVLVGLALLAAVGGMVLSAAADPVILGIAAFAGMFNGMGRDRGAALVLEQAILPGTVSDHRRTGAFAWYHVLQDAGHALGGLLAGLPAVLEAKSELSGIPAVQASIGVYAGLSGLPALVYLGLSAFHEPRGRGYGQAVSSASKRLLWKISALFGLDSLGGGFLTTAILAYFFAEQFGVSGAVIGTLFFVARMANALSHLAAAWLARRLGLVNTMVWTHVPSHVLLVLIVLAPSFLMAAILFLLREALVEMDVPTRESYVMAVVQPQERTAASGVTNLVRLGGWAAAPALAGLAMEYLALGVPLVIGAVIKIVYDLLLFWVFRNVKPPEERALPASPTSS